METINDICAWGLLTIIRHTGVRVHEALNVQEPHLSLYFLGKPLLEVINDKTQTDRYIPVSKEVVNEINKVSEATREARNQINTEKIFINHKTRKKTFEGLRKTMQECGEK